MYLSPNHGDFGESDIHSTIPPNGGLTTDLSGTLTGYFKLVWTTANVAAPAYPDHITLLLQTKVNAQVSQDYGTTGYTYGLLAFATASDSYNETAQANLWEPSQGTTCAPPPTIGMHLVQAAVDPNIGIATISVSGTSHQYVWNTIPYHKPPDSTGNVEFIGVATAFAEADVNAGARLDDRAVVLQRNGARAVNKFTASNGQVYGEWVAPDGTVHGDTTYSYWTVSNAGLSLIIADQINWQTFTPVFAGQWPIWSSTWSYPSYTPWYIYTGDPYDPLYVSDIDTSNAEIANARTQNAPAVAWSWLPNESDDWELYGKWSAPDGNGIGWSPSGSGDPGLTATHPPLTKTISYSAKESVAQHFPWQNNLSILDGASLTKTYQLTFHDAVEGWHTNGIPFDSAPLTFPYIDTNNQPIWQPSGTTLLTTFPKQLDYIDYGPGIRTIGGLLAGGSVLLPLTVTSPLGIGIASLMSVVSFQAGLYNNPAPTWPINVTTQLPDFKLDFSDQVKINKGTAVASPPSNPNWVLSPTIPRFTDTSRADWLASLSSDDQYNYWYGTGPGGKFVVTAVDVLPQIITPYAAYQFDTSGLILDSNNQPIYAFANVKTSGTPYSIRQWSWVATPIPH